MIDTAKTSVVVVAYPDLRMDPDLTLWLVDIGIPRNNILRIKGNDRDVCIGHNAAVEMSLTRKVEWCLFAEADMRPYAQTAPLLAAPYDITGVTYDTECGDKSWVGHDSFHAGLWVARRATLAKLRGPWFRYGTNASGSKLEACRCAHFVRLAKAAGLTIGHAGHAHHWPRGSKLPDAIPLIGCKQ